MARTMSRGRLFHWTPTFSRDVFPASGIGFAAGENRRQRQQRAHQKHEFSHGNNLIQDCQERKIEAN